MHFLCSICKYFITASVIKLFSSLLFYWTGNWRILPLIFTEEIFTTNTNRTVTAWLYCLKARTVWLALQIWNYIFQYSLCALTAAAKLVFVVCWWWRWGYIYFFHCIYLFFLKLKLKRTFWMQKLKIFFQKNNYLDNGMIGIFGISVKIITGVCSIFAIIYGNVHESVWLMLFNFCKWGIFSIIHFPVLNKILMKNFFL